MRSEPGEPGAAPSLASRAQVVAALLAVQVMFGVHYVAAKLVVEAIPPRIWAAMRVVGAAALLYGLVRVSGQRLPRGRGILPRFALFAVLGVAINQICFVEGLSRTTPVNSSLINCSIPVLTMLIAVLARQERATAARLAGIGLALAGILVLLRVEEFDPGDVLVRGNLLTLVNSLSFSTFLVVSRPTLRRIPTLPATSLLFLLGLAPVAAASAPAWPGFDPAAVKPAVWALAALIIVFPTVLAYLLNYWALRRAPSSLVALFIYVQPVIAAVLSILLREETITARKVAAFVLVAAGIAVVVREATPRRRNPG